MPFTQLKGETSFGETLKTGNAKQCLAYQAIGDLGVLKDLANYTPVVCGTIPIGIDMENSDLDIILEVSDLDCFDMKVENLYSNLVSFSSKRTRIRGMDVSKTNFVFSVFEFELFGQAQEVYNQNAYLHMMIEQALMDEDPSIREKVIYLKQQGYKTEPAFCEIIGLEGDPYLALIRFGKEKGIV